jgi:hypothetical protein
MLIGRLSGEWLFVALVGLIVTAAIAFDAPENVLLIWEYWAIGAAALGINWGTIRLLGRSSSKSVDPESPAGKGHPRLTILLSLIHVFVWAFRPAMLFFGQP